LIVVDIQGAVLKRGGGGGGGVDNNRNYMLTDPQIHSKMSEEIYDEGQYSYE